MSYGDVQIAGKTVWMLALVVIVVTLTVMICSFIDHALRGMFI